MRITRRELEELMANRAMLEGDTSGMDDEAEWIAWIRGIVDHMQAFHEDPAHPLLPKERHMLVGVQQELMDYGKRRPDEGLMSKDHRRSAILNERDNLLGQVRMLYDAVIWPFTPHGREYFLRNPWYLRLQRRRYEDQDGEAGAGAGAGAAARGDDEEQDEIFEVVQGREDDAADDVDDDADDVDDDFDEDAMIQRALTKRISTPGRRLPPDDTPFLPLAKRIPMASYDVLQMAAGGTFWLVMEGEENTVRILKGQLPHGQFERIDNPVSFHPDTVVPLPPTQYDARNVIEINICSGPIASYPDSPIILYVEGLRRTRSLSKKHVTYVFEAVPFVAPGVMVPSRFPLYYDDHVSASVTMECEFAVLFESGDQAQTGMTDGYMTPYPPLAKEWQHLASAVRVSVITVRRLNTSKRRLVVVDTNGRQNYVSLPSKPAQYIAMQANADQRSRGINGYVLISFIGHATRNALIHLYKIFQHDVMLIGQHELNDHTSATVAFSRRNDSAHPAVRAVTQERQRQHEEMPEPKFEEFVVPMNRDETKMERVGIIRGLGNENVHHVHHLSNTSIGGELLTFYRDDTGLFSAVMESGNIRKLPSPMQRDWFVSASSVDAVKSPRDMYVTFSQPGMLTVLGRDEGGEIVVQGVRYFRRPAPPTGRFAMSFTPGTLFSHKDAYAAAREQVLVSSKARWGDARANLPPPDRAAWTAQVQSVPSSPSAAGAQERPTSEPTHNAWMEEPHQEDVLRVRHGGAEQNNERQRLAAAEMEAQRRREAVRRMMVAMMERGVEGQGGLDVVVADGDVGEAWTAPGQAGAAGAAAGAPNRG
jgi:hypothetical protein